MGPTSSPLEILSSALFLQWPSWSVAALSNPCWGVLTISQSKRNSHTRLRGYCLTQLGVSRSIFTDETIKHLILRLFFSVCFFLHNDCKERPHNSTSACMTQLGLRAWRILRLRIWRMRTKKSNKSTRETKCLSVGYCCWDFIGNTQLKLQVVACQPTCLIQSVHFFTLGK